MTGGVALLVLASALVHAGWNAILKRTREPENSVAGMMAVAAVSAAIVALVMQVPWPERTSLAWCVASGVLEAGYFVTLARALSRAPLGPVYTIVRGGALVVVWPVSVLVLGERLDAVRLAGTVLIALGLVAAGASERASSTAPTSSPAPSRLRLREGLTYAAVCALFVGGYHLAYKLALANGGRPQMVVAISLCTASAVNLATLGRVRARRVLDAARAQPGATVIAGVLATLGFVVFLSAMAHAGAGVVLTLRNTSILFAQVLAWFLGERPRRLGVAGALFVTAGAALLAH